MTPSHKDLPKTALRQTASRIFASKIEQKQLMNRIVPEATFKRRRDRLSAAESERTERMARVVANAEYVWVRSRRRAPIPDHCASSARGQDSR